MSISLLHTADWHLGKKLGRFNRHKEQVAVLDEICQIAERHQVDGIIIAGDVFDTYNPPNESVELFYQTVHRLSKGGERWVWAIAGNHDSPDQLEVPDSLARANGIFLAGHPHSQVKDTQLPSFSLKGLMPGLSLLDYSAEGKGLFIIHTPYANAFRLNTFFALEQEEKDLRESLSHHWQSCWQGIETLRQEKPKNKYPAVLIGHAFVIQEGEEEVEEEDGEKPTLHVGGAQALYSHNFPSGLDYVALGHLHRPHAVSKKPYPIVYSGSPLAYSFAEREQQKSCELISWDNKGQMSQQKLPLLQGKTLIRKAFDSVENAISWLQANSHCWVELVLDTEQYISSVDKNRLLDTHQGIVALVPRLKDGLQEASTSADRLHLDMKSLFKQFFVDKTGQLPNEEQMRLLEEIINSTEKEEAT